MSIPIKIIFLLIGIALLAWWGLRWFERANLYFPDPSMEVFPQSYGLSYETVTLTTSDHQTLSAWWLPASAKAKATLLFCHGNAGNISHRLEKLKIFHEVGLSVFIFDYRGYGKSSGRPDETGTYEDAATAYRWLTETKGIAPDDLIIYGESLGGAVATETATRFPRAALILESAFTSTVAMANRVFPWLPARWIVRYRYDNLNKISKIPCRLLVMHSPQDDIVPYTMGRQLFDAAKAPKSFVELKGDHNEGFLTSGRLYPEALTQFIRTLEKERKISQK